jgi:endonuclease/exonuclease/phosphatase (EEP) superfamily protein YafD
MDARNKAPANRLNTALRSITFAGAFFLFALSLPAVLPDLAPSSMDLPSHFALQYLIASVILLGWSFYPLEAGRETKIILALALFINVAVLARYLPLSGGPEAAAGKPLRILQANILYLNTRPAAFQALVAQEKPDIIFVMETNSAFAKALKAMKAEYPYQHIMPENQWADGLALISKTPLENLQVLNLKDAAMPGYAFRIRQGKEKIEFVALHTMNPLHGVEIRDASFKGVEKRYQNDVPQNLVILGDLNATPWCPALQRFTRALPGMRNARAGRGLFLSWPTFLPIFMRIPIDHTLVSDNIAVTDYRIGPDIGSDHFPVIATLAPGRVK